MEDGLKISKDKRHRSSSSLAGVGLEGTRSERKLDLRVSIPEVEDQFAIAEARCDNLQEQIDIVKNLKKKKKLKKRSMTRLTEHQQMENVPLISVLTQPKKKVTMSNARFRRIDMPLNSTRSYLDPPNEHHRTGRGFQPMAKPITEKPNPTKVAHSKQSIVEVLSPVKNKVRRTRAEGGDNALEISGRKSKSCEVACGEDDAIDLGGYYNDSHEAFSVKNSSTRESVNSKQQVKTGAGRRKITPRETVKAPKNQDLRRNIELRRQPGPAVNKSYNKVTPSSTKKREERERRPVVELFNKSQQEGHKLQRVASADTNVSTNVHDTYTRYYGKDEDTATQPEYQERTGVSRNQSKGRLQQEFSRQPRRIRYRSRRYELPTVASQMKQAGARYYYGNNNINNIPFIVSKSTAPSHNIGVNIQQVLNGLKIQQPLSGIPFTIAHHMGLGHVPHYRKQSSTPVQPSLDALEMNVIRLGQKLVHLPSKYMSYNRLLSLYREGEGMVPRFLRAISRPHYFYTSMYNLSTRIDHDGATSKGRGASQEAKQSLTEYAALYREYEKVDRSLKEEHDHELELRKDELARELALREDHIRKVVQEFKTGPDTEQSTVLRASASTADESYRNSGFRINLGEHLQ